ncbi:helix-turn-helix transcriptional regulator [Bradyrhizobium sp. SZCCHNS2022]|uniref:helix-turn-helix transcriptional regulator n=1 Tax=unclassified Bradyrhizobium TaxID=2631580 RepID=UPI0039658040
MHHISTDELIPADEVADALHLRRQTLAAWRTLGRGPSFVKVGRTVFYRRADIEAWLGAQRREPVRASTAATA